MAIEPSGVIFELNRVSTVDEIRPCLDRIFSYLPTCINRAIGTIQCAQLEPAYKTINARFKAEFDFDLHQAFKDQVALILARKR